MNSGNEIVQHYDQSPAGLPAKINTNPLLHWDRCHRRSFCGNTPGACMQVFAKPIAFFKIDWLCSKIRTVAIVCMHASTRHSWLESVFIHFGMFPWRYRQGQRDRWDWWACACVFPAAPKLRLRSRYVSYYLPQENVSSLLVWTKSVNRSVRTNPGGHLRICTVQLHLEECSSGPDSSGDEPLLCDVSRVQN